ncbi:hypothetical protein KC19_12G112800 [Ceratodon purpureus]|uniref:Uncharacterized protein n=1 Tax=Ceratodon purpureus TaxID=3225 RepID=A0A8T0G6Q4_CERPU|nr:hypothetical protein KC19_12G112800 [Ceratodon purpureus]
MATKMETQMVTKMGTKMATKMGTKMAIRKETRMGTRMRQQIPEFGNTDMAGSHPTSTHTSDSQSWHKCHPKRIINHVIICDIPTGITSLHNGGFVDKQMTWYSNWAHDSKFNLL